MRVWYAYGILITIPRGELVLHAKDEPSLPQIVITQHKHNNTGHQGNSRCNVYTVT